MSNENETNEDEFCLGCNLVDEYYQLLEDGVSEEVALKYVIHTAMEIRDEEISVIVSDTYSDGFEEGLRLGVEKSAKLLNDLVDYTDEQIADYHAECKAEKEAEMNVELDKESEEIEDISDEDFEKLTKIIFDNK